MLTLRGLARTASNLNVRRFSNIVVNHDSIFLKDFYRGSVFPFVWLRDACQCPSCIHPSTQQKLHNTTDIPINITPVNRALGRFVQSKPAQWNGVSLKLDDLYIQWSDGHDSVYSRDFLSRWASAEAMKYFHADINPVPWTRETIQKQEDLYVPYSDLNTSQGALRAINQLLQFGILFIQDVPNEETSDAACELKKLANRFGEIRETFYGAVWDVRNQKNSKNIAYTNLHLGLHMDLLYFQHPPRYQILHCLRNRVEGGTSIFVDALAAAETLSTVDTAILSEVPVNFHYINDSHHLHWSHPTLEMTPSKVSENRPIPQTPSHASPAKQSILHINYSPPFQAPLPLNTPPYFYTSLNHFAEVLNSPQFTYEYTLKEGDAVLFDNRRVLHARTAFREREAGEGFVGEGETSRWLKGCYLEADAILDRGRLLRKEESHRL